MQANFPLPPGSVLGLLGGGQLGITTRRVDGVLDAPEAGVLRDDLRRQQADKRRLKMSIMAMSQMMPKASVMPKPLTEAAARKNRHSADTMVTRSASMEVKMACFTPVMEAAFTERPMRSPRGSAPR